MRRKTKNTLKTVGMTVLGLALVVGAGAGIKSLVDKQDEELKVIHPTFEVGGLTDDGKYEESDETIYTKEAFECQGLEIKLEFDNTIDYQVFYYEDDGDFLSASEVINGNQELVVPNEATHARIEITPNWDEMGEDFEDKENQVIKWYQVNKFASQMEVKVSKEQLTPSEKFYESIEDLDEACSLLGAGLYNPESGFSASATAPYYWQSAINTTGYTELIIKVKTSTLTCRVMFNDSERDGFTMYLDETAYSNSTIPYEVLFVDDDISFISIDVSSVGQVCYCTDIVSANITEAYLR